MSCLMSHTPDIFEILQEVHSMRVLLVLYERGPLNKTPLYREISQNTSAVQKRIDSLEEVGLVSVEPSPDHRSAFIVDLTDHGRRIAEHIKAIEEIYLDLTSKKV